MKDPHDLPVLEHPQQHGPAAYLYLSSHDYAAIYTKSHLEFLVSADS